MRVDIHLPFYYYLVPYRNIRTIYILYMCVYNICMYRIMIFEWKSSTKKLLFFVGYFLATIFIDFKIKMDSGKNILWVCRRSEPILDYISKIDGKTEFMQQRIKVMTMLVIRIDIKCSYFAFFNIN